MPARVNEPRRAAKVARQRAHVRAVVNAVVDARVFGREQVVVWRIGGHEHSVADQGSPPHGLLFGDWGMAPTPGRTKPMNAMSGREAWMMLRMLACVAVG